MRLQVVQPYCRLSCGGDAYPQFVQPYCRLNRGGDAHLQVVQPYCRLSRGGDAHLQVVQPCSAHLQVCCLLLFVRLHFVILFLRF